MKVVLVVGLGLAGFLGVVTYKADPQVVIFATGVLFGVMAGVPMALLVIASQRQKDRQVSERPQAQPQQPMIMMMGGYPQTTQPPETIDVQAKPLPRLSSNSRKEIKYQEW